MKKSTMQQASQRRAYPKLDPTLIGKPHDCLCGCGQTVNGKAAFASDACRKRYQRAIAQKSEDAKATVAEQIAKKTATAAAAANDTPPAAVDKPSSSKITETDPVEPDAADEGTLDDAAAAPETAAPTKKTK